MSASSNSRKTLFRALAVILAVMAAIAVGEILTRLFWKGKPAFVTDERNLTYQYDAELGWFPIPDGSRRFKGDHFFTIRHNHDGFRDGPHGPKTKKRIAFVGDSFVWGYDAEQEERFTEKLQARLPDWEILNLGVSGYATDQELLLLRRWFERYQPDIVVLVFSDNDVEENGLNVVHGGYYKPYFELVEGKPVEKGVPVPKCIHYYRAEHPLLFKSALAQLLTTWHLARTAPTKSPTPNPTLPLVAEMRAYVQSKGAKFILAFCSDIEGQKKLAFVQAYHFDALFLLAGPTFNWDYMYNTGGHHWTPRGHDLVASKLYDFLTTNQFLATEQSQRSVVTSPRSP